MLRFILIFIFGFSPKLTHAQTAQFKIDSLLSSYFNTVNTGDSANYINCLQSQPIFTLNSCKTKKDSIALVKRFWDGYTEFTTEVKEIVGSSEIHIAYDSFKTWENLDASTTQSRLVKLFVQLIINDKIALKIPFFVYNNNDHFNVAKPLQAAFMVE